MEKLAQSSAAFQRGKLLMSWPDTSQLHHPTDNSSHLDSSSVPSTLTTAFQFFGITSSATSLPEKTLEGLETDSGTQDVSVGCMLPNSRVIHFCDTWSLSFLKTESIFSRLVVSHPSLLLLLLTFLIRILQLVAAMRPGPGHQHHSHFHQTRLCFYLAATFVCSAPLRHLRRTKLGSQPTRQTPTRVRIFCYNSLLIGGQPTDWQKAMCIVASVKRKLQIVRIYC